MMNRHLLEEVITGLIDFGKLVTSAVSSAKNTVLHEVVADVDPEGNEEKDSDAESFIHPAILWRPSDEDAEGACEVLLVRRGDELLIIGGKDRRWQLSVDKGEVVVRGMAADSGHLALKPDGEIHAVPGAGKGMLIGGAAATEAIPLGDALKTWLDGHKHTYIPDGSGTAALTTEPQTEDPAPGTPDPSPRPSTKHKVENGAED